MRQRAGAAPAARFLAGFSLTRRSIAPPTSTSCHLIHLPSQAPVSRFREIGLNPTAFCILDCVPLPPLIRLTPAPLQINEALPPPHHQLENGIPPQFNFGFDPLPSHSAQLIRPPMPYDRLIRCTPPPPPTLFSVAIGHGACEIVDEDCRWQVLRCVFMLHCDFEILTLNRTLPPSQPRINPPRTGPLCSNKPLHVASQNRAPAARFFGWEP